VGNRTYRCIAARWLGDLLGWRRAAQQLRQLSEVRRHAAGLVLGERLGRRAPAGLFLEVKVAERLPGAVADDEASVVRLIDRPGRRKAAGRHANFGP
jgi:hypothetical protein